MERRRLLFSQWRDCRHRYVRVCAKGARHLGAAMNAQLGREVAGEGDATEEASVDAFCRVVDAVRPLNQLKEDMVG